MTREDKIRARFEKADAMGIFYYGSYTRSDIDYLLKENQRLREAHLCN